MIFLLAAVFALIGFLNPFLAVVYGVGIVGDRLLKSGKLNIFFLAAFVCFGLIAVLGKLNRVDFFELSLLLLAVFVYFHLLLAKGSYDLAILGAGVFFFAGEYIIFASFNALFIQVIEKAFSAAGQMFAGSDNLQYLDLAKKIYLNNYPSLYGVLGLVSLYGSSILLGRKHEIPKFEFRNFDLPGWIDFWLIGGLLLSFFGKSLPLSLGSNLLFFLVALYVFVGMGVVFTVWKKWFEKSKILYVLFFLVVVLNNLLLFVLSFLGLLDRWFDFRKLNRRKNESDFN